MSDAVGVDHSRDAALVGEVAARGIGVPTLPAAVTVDTSALALIGQ
jgi:hypothetical protein